MTMEKEGKAMSPEMYANLMEALGIMGKGMLGIFVVMILIALIVFFMTRLGNKGK